MKISFDDTSRIDLGWLLLLGLIVIGAGIGLRDPWPADEPRFALIARDMVNSGNWLFPMRGGELYPDKPPLFMWMQAVFYYLTGSVRIAFLLPGLVAGLSSLVLVYDLANRLWDRRTAVAAGFLLLFTFQFTLQARSGQIDAVVSFWICLSIYGLMRHMLLGPHWRWYWFGCFAAGLGVITKGVGVIALLALIPFFFARMKNYNHLATIEPSPGRWWAGFGFMLLAIGLWFVPMVIQVAASGDPDLVAYRDNILLRQTAERYASAWHHHQPFWYYLLEVIPFFWLPVSVLLPWLIPAWRRDLKNRDARILLPLAWVFLVILFFSLSPGKRGVYLTPATTMLALVCAPHLDKLLDNLRVQRLLYVVTLLLVLPWAVLSLIWLLRPEQLEWVYQKYLIEPWLLVLAFAVCGAIILSLIRPRQGALAYGAFMVSFWLCVGFVGYPLFNEMRSSRNLTA